MMYNLNTEKDIQCDLQVLVKFAGTVFKNYVFVACECKL